jgi:ATP synthase F1 gamma subunit
MPSLDDLKKRISSVKSTQKITKAMKMVAAAKLRKAQESAEDGRPFSEKMNKIIFNLSNSITDKDSASKFLILPIEVYAVDLIQIYVEKQKVILIKLSKKGKHLKFLQLDQKVTIN